MTTNHVAELDARMSTHEQICALRQEQILARLDRLEKIILGVVGSTMLVLFTYFIHAIFIK